ncbi:MAG: sensor histidine kinase KdpD [Planctomycetota bacterium]
MPDTRPDPAELLARVKREEARAVGEASRRGKLKIFFGMSPGVGKTYAMLAAAQRLAAQGVDVVVGVVETHGRGETEQMTLGLDVLPRRSIVYRGADGTSTPVTLTEFDLDAAIKRKPDVLLVDELAHTNAQGSSNEKRWQDVQACLSAGINVYTTLNVQHLESLNDIVAQITGVTVRETIPDSVVEGADEIELVDLPPDALLERLRAGKVYVPDAAKQAIDSFFRAGNLTALRQLALRRTAEWVDQRMREYKDDHGIHTVWAATDRILVAVSPSPASPRLVRAAKRMAASLRAELIAVYVEGPDADRMPQADRDRVLQTLRLAESLGAETATITYGAGRASATGPRGAAAELVSFARSRNVTRIVIGKTQRARASEAIGMLLGRGSFSSDVIRASGEIEVVVLQGQENEDRRAPAQSPVDSAQSAGTMWTGDLMARLGASILLVTACTGLSSLVFRQVDLANIAMLYLAGVVVAAMWLGRAPAIVACVLGVAAFDFFFVPPHLTLAVSDIQYLITFAVMLAVGLLIAHLTARLKALAEAARDRERRTASLYAMARELAAAQSLADTATVAARHVASAFDADVVVAIASASAPEGVDILAWGGVSPDWLNAGGAAEIAAGVKGLEGTGGGGRNRSVARWVLDHGKPAGLGTSILAAAQGRFMPLSTTQGRVGVLGIRPTTPHAQSRLLSTDRLLLLDTFAAQVAAAIERVRLIESREAARVDAESERLRGALLSSVSHDLRTPLATIAGSASTLRESGDRLDSATRSELIDSIVTEAARLNDLIANLVFATRLESGAIDLQRDWSTVEEIVGSGLARHREALAHRPLRTIGLGSGLPMVKVDSAMLPMVVHNLVENAIRYTPQGTPISIAAWRSDNNVVIRVADEGPGLAEGETARVFQRFYRGRTARLAQTGQAGAAGGMGLGLTICEGIIKAHRGRIWAEPNTPHGVAFLFSLPLDEPQPVVAKDPEEVPA